MNKLLWVEGFVQVRAAAYIAYVIVLTALGDPEMYCRICLGVYAIRLRTTAWWPGSHQSDSTDSRAQRFRAWLFELQSSCDAHHHPDPSDLGTQSASNCLRRGQDAVAPELLLRQSPAEDSRLSLVEGSGIKL